MTETLTGACLCGQVSYQVTGPFNEFHICHCSQCRRSTGTAHASNIFTSADRLRWMSGEALIKRFTPDKPDVISKCFCTHCGSLVPYTSLKSGKLIIPAGSLDQTPKIIPEDNIFWGDRAEWYDSVATAKHCNQGPE
ncbi:MAG: hypothetical protein ACI845_000775 [Gammaproteobacteria bacterium]|jgi:hypothetical protein